MKPINRLSVIFTLAITPFIASESFAAGSDCTEADVLLSAAAVRTEITSFDHTTDAARTAYSRYNGGLKLLGNRSADRTKTPDDSSFETTYELVEVALSDKDHTTSKMCKAIDKYDAALSVLISNRELPAFVCPYATQDEFVSETAELYVQSLINSGVDPDYICPNGIVAELPLTGEPQIFAYCLGILDPLLGIDWSVWLDRSLELEALELATEGVTNACANLQI